MAAPIKHTCPDIDRAIKHLKQAKDECKGLIEDKREYQSIEYEIEAAIGYFEDLRSANDTLRQWGEELESELQTAGEEINSLEEKIEELKSTTA